MASKASNSRFSSTVPLPVGLDLPTERRVRAPAVDFLAISQTDLSRAWSEFNSGHIDEAKSLLIKLCSDLEQRLTLTAKESDQVSISLLYGSALSTLGRIHQFLGSDDEALSKFRKAVNEFRKSLPNEPQATSQMYCDYAVGLFHIGNHRKALEAFTEAQKRGALNAEADRYLGISQERMGNYEEAEQHFIEAIKQAPTDYSSHITLAKFYEKRRRTPDAVAEYGVAIDYLTGAGLLDEAMKFVDRVVKLTKQDPRMLAKKAEILRLKGDYDAALDAINASLKREPKRADALALKGLILLAQENDSEAISYLQKAASLDSNMDWVQVSLAAALINVGNLKKALTVLKQALDLQPDNADAWFLQAHALYRLNKPQDALHSLDRTLKLTPNNAIALGQKGQILQELNQYQKAIKALRRSLEIDPNLFWVHAELGWVLYSVANDDEALKELNEALALQPNYTFAMVRKGEVLRTLGRLEEALQVLHQAVSLEPQNARAVAIKGQILHELGQEKEAVETLKQAINLNPTEAWVHVELSAALYNLENYEECLKVLDQGLSIEQQGDWNFFKAHVLCQIGEFKRAIKALNKSIELDGPHADRCGLKGWALQHIGPKYFKEALGAYEVAAKLAPDNLWWHKGVANGLYLLGEKTKAADKYDWVLKQAERQMKSDTAEDILSLIGWCQFRLGKWEDAVRSFSQVLFSYPDEVATQFDLALALMCGERYTEALREYRRGLDIAKEKRPLRCRGLASVAYDDLKVAIDNVPSLGNQPQPQEALLLLTTLCGETSA